MVRPCLVSQNAKDKYYHKKIKGKRMILSSKVSFFLSFFLIGGIAVAYYKYLVKEQEKQNIF